MSFNDYDFKDTQTMYDILYTKNIYTLICRNKRYRKIMKVEKIIPDIIMMPSTPSDYSKFIVGHIDNIYSPLCHVSGMCGNIYIYFTTKVIIDNLYINFSTDLHDKIEQALGPNPSFVDEILLKHIPNYEIKIFFNGIKAERDLYNILYEKNYLEMYKFKRVMEKIIK